MDLRETIDDGLVVIAVRGDLDHGNSSLLEERLFAHFARDVHHLVLDLEQCPYMDGAGLSALFAHLVRLPEDRVLAVAAPGPNLRRLFGVVGLAENERFRIYDDARAAARDLIART